MGNEHTDFPVWMLPNKTATRNIVSRCKQHSWVALIRILPWEPAFHHFYSFSIPVRWRKAWQYLSPSNSFLKHWRPKASKGTWTYGKLGISLVWAWLLSVPLASFTSHSLRPTVDGLWWFTLWMVYESGLVSSDQLCPLGPLMLSLDPRCPWPLGYSHKPVQNNLPQTLSRCPRHQGIAIAVNASPTRLDVDQDCPIKMPHDATMAIRWTGKASLVLRNA